MSDRPESPFNDLPPAVVALALVIAGIELAFQIGSYGVIGGPDAVGWRLAALERFAFFDPIFDEMVARNLWPVEHVWRIVSYAFVHPSFVSALFVAVFVLAFGKMAGERFGSFAVIAIFFVATVLGALSYGLILTTNTPLVGGYPGAFGLLGAYTFLLWVGLGAMGHNRLMAFRVILFLVGVQLLFSIFYGLPPDLLAEVVGFATGFVMAILFVPGAVPRILDKLRQR